MTDRERAVLLAAAAIVVCGTAAGALTGGSSGDPVRTGTQVARSGTVGQSNSASPPTTTDPGAIGITPPVASDAPDTLKELYDGDRVENTTYTDFGIVTIAETTYEGISTNVDREGIAGAPQIVIATSGRYKRINGVVGIRDDTECTENAASVSITNANGDRLWGPERVGFNSPTRFDISIRNRARVSLDQLSIAPRDNPCDGEAHVAWANVEFVK